MVGKAPKNCSCTLRPFYQFDGARRRNVFARFGGTDRSGFVQGISATFKLANRWAFK